MKYYSAAKKGKILIHTIWMNLQRIMLSTNSQSQIVPYDSTYITLMKDKIIGLKNTLVIARGQGGDRGGKWQMWH